MAVDVETANRGRHSICQIGIVGFRGGTECFAYQALVDPEEAFEPFNTVIHGIASEQVSGEQTFGQLHPWISSHLSARIAVAHSAFDRSALSAACDRHRLAEVDCHWLDSLTVAKQAWPGLKSYKLSHLADRIGIRFRHHDALEDARTAGLILLHAIEEIGGTPEEWFGPLRRRRGF